MISISDAIVDVSKHAGPLRIGVLSDTHGEISTHVLEQLQGSEIILHAGDVCGQSVLDELATITPRVFAVAGNNDGHFSYRDDSLPEHVQLRAPGGEISLLHGHQFGRHQPSHDSMREAFASSRTIIYGHSHHQVSDTDATPVVLNPGAAGNTRTNGGASCAIVIADQSADWQVSLFRAP